MRVRGEMTVTYIMIVTYIMNPIVTVPFYI